ncbi:hypothetical protein TNCV_2809941 [Trichonephila clavipes]|nr:hypothetical protein TNCV_2809941 [Trichonephila clavipes]
MQDALCLLALAVALRFETTHSVQPHFEPFFFVEAKPFALVSSRATFLRLLRFPQVVFRVEIRLTSSTNAAADCGNSVVIIDETCATIIWPKLLQGRGLRKELKEHVG